jgi:hypothetical protein
MKYVCCGGAHGYSFPFSIQFGIMPLTKHRVLAIVTA